MITTSSKFFYGLAGGLLVAAVVYGYTTGGGNVGPISLGYKGGVGDVLGYTLLTVGGVLAAFIGLAATAFRDGDPDVAADMVGDDTAPTAAAPAVSHWPILSAFAIGLVVVGLVLNNVFFVIGLIALGAIAIEWTMQTWAERATGDPAVNRELRNRVMTPFEVPLGGLAIVGIVIFGYSRVFLAVSADNAVWVALAVAAIVFGVGTLLSTRGSIRKDVIAGLLTLGAVVTIVVGIVASLAGERDFHHEPAHGDEPSGEEQGDEHAAAPAAEHEGTMVLEESK